MTVDEMKEVLKSHPLPKYSKGEETFNWVSHLVGVVFGLITLGTAIGFTILNDYSWIESLSLFFYAFCMILLYLNSTIYHALPKTSTWKKLFRLIDHNTIYFLIAGTYAPICAFAFKETNIGIIIFSIEIIGLLIGTLLNLFNLNGKAIKVITVILYVVMGWAIIFYYPALRMLETTVLLLILFGGISYTLGVLFYVLGKKKKWMHSIFHLFVLIGTILQFIGVLLII
ncbi:MAG: hemolysin III family protein [Bacilli bacterium]|jgi:hemolysin III|nr:hemolysin III family protein [Bacilli bacterium]